MRNHETNKLVKNVEITALYISNISFFISVGRALLFSLISWSFKVLWSIILYSRMRFLSILQYIINIRQNRVHNVKYSFLTISIMCFRGLIHSLKQFLRRNIHYQQLYPVIKYHNHQLRSSSNYTIKTLYGTGQQKDILSYTPDFTRCLWDILNNIDDSNWCVKYIVFQMLD